jgi:putative spermidine/putrescine transport system ATP-binding protein
VYVTHDQSEAFAISDRIVVMNAGRVEQIGTQTDIYLQPQTRFVAEFIGANNGLEGTIVAIDGSGEEARATVRVGDLTLRARARDGLAVGDAVIAYLRPEDVRLLDGEDGGWPNVVEGIVDRVIFEGPTAQVRVDVGGRQLRADVGGNRRLTVGEGAGRIRLGFDDLTIVPAEPKP